MRGITSASARGPPVDAAIATATSDGAPPAARALRGGAGGRSGRGRRGMRTGTAARFAAAAARRASSSWSATLARSGEMVPDGLAMKSTAP
jgi:hypothetical protein